MKFHSIQIGAFGALSETTIDGLEQGLSVIHGPNGAGKTTLLHFLRGVFCGYSEAHRLGLLPAAGGESGGGAVGVHWKGDEYRCERAAADDKLRVKLVRGDRETASPGFAAQHLPSVQIPLLYTVGHADVLTLDELIQTALHDGIDLVTRTSAPDRQTTAARNVLSQQSQPSDTERDRIDGLSELRRWLREELEQLGLKFQEASRRFTEVCRQQQLEMSAHCRRKFDWLHAELQAAESDLREAEERTWRTDGGQRRPLRKRTSPAVRLRRIPSLSHIEVSPTQQLEDLDHQIATARVRLAEIANDRLQAKLGIARIAGSPEFPTDEFLGALRTSLAAMEDSLLELRRDAGRLESNKQERDGLSETWPATTKVAVDEVRRRLYGACEHISRFELQQRLAELRARAARCDEEEHVQLQRLQSLLEQWQEIVAHTGYLKSWRGPAQDAVEKTFCRCTQHTAEMSVSRVNQAATAVEMVSVERAALAPLRPTPQELQRLVTRRNGLRSELDAAQREWRHSKLQPTQAELPDELRSLELRIGQKQHELATVEQQLTDSREKWRVLSVTGEVVHPVEHTVAAEIRPECIQWAAEYLSRLTAGRYVDLRVTEEHGLRVIDEAGAERARGTLSCGTLQQVAISLRLALVRAYAKRGIRFPLVLDDVLIDCDIERLQEAARLLREFALQHDQQILYLTCGTHLVSLFDAEGSSVRGMPGTTLISSKRPSSSNAPARWTVRGWVDQRPTERDVAPNPKASADGTPNRSADNVPPKPIVEQVSPDELTPQRVASAVDRAAGFQALQRRQPGGPYWLSMDSPLALVPSIGEQMGRRMSALGIQSVADLLELAAEESSIPLKSLQVNVARLREWQAEARLLCCVPDLTGPDAQLLVACGVHDPRQLAECDVAQIISRLDRYSRRNQDHHFGADQPTRDDYQRWIHNARRSRSLADARRESRRETRQRRERSVTRETTSRSDRSSLRDFHTQASSVSEGAVVARFSSSARTPSEVTATEPRFYLSPESPVVDAPSIGPKMASRLHKLGIITVADLLARSAGTIAERLGHRRVNEQTVIVWQQQARIMCRIPQLRGHDAQVLVACDFTEPEQVARLDARSLFAIVGPFVETKEGQRLLRSSKTPDLAEVAEWIDWAHQARPLRAA